MFMNLVPFFGLIIVVLKFNTCFSDGSIDCDNSEDVVNTEELDLNFYGVIKTFFDVKITSIISTTNNKFDELYIDAVIENDENDRTNLVIFTTEKFRNYSREQSSPQIFLNIKFECPGGARQTQLFYQPLKEGNYFQPQFSKDLYEIVIPTPLYKGFELTIFQEIYATDFDLIGSDIAFSSTDAEDSSILVGTLKHFGKKSLASLELMTILLSLNEEIEFSIVATDSGNPPLQSSPAKVIIIADILNRLPPIPRFDKTVYYASLTDNFILPELKVTLDYATYSSDISFMKISDTENIFKIENIDNVVLVTLNKIDEEYLKGKERLTFDIEASNKKLMETGRTAVSISIPSKKDLQFAKGLYKGKLFVKSNTLEIEHIEMLGNENQLRQVELELKEPHPALFNVRRDDDIVQLFLKPDVSLDTLISFNYISLKLMAKLNSEEVSTTYVNVDIIHTTLQFEKTVYFGSLSSNGELALDPIILLTNPDPTNNELEWKTTKFLLTGRDANYFNYEHDNSVITISLKQNTYLREMCYLWTELKAISSEKIEHSVFIVVDIDHQPIPEFEELNYIGELMQDNILNISHIVIKMSTWRNYTSVKLTGEYSDYFEHAVVDNEIVILIKSELPDELKTQSPIVLVVIASNNDVNGYATVVINLHQNQIIRNIFKRTIQKGRIFEDENLLQILKIEDIEFVNEINVADFTCELSGDESRYLHYTAITPKNVIQLSMAEELPYETLQKKFYTSVLLECKNIDNAAIIGSTVIFLTLPGNNVENLCPTPEPPSFVPEFEKKMYSFYATPTFVGPLYKVYATIMDSSADVRYLLNVKNEHLRSRLNIDSNSGEIFLSALTSPGRYEFDIIAENVMTHGKGAAKAQLDIEALIQCEDHISVSNSLVIKYLEEEMEHDSIMNVMLGDCEFYVFSMDPNDREYIKIDPATKMLTMIPTDREDSIFTDMIMPQIQVKLKLHCSSDQMSERTDNFNMLTRAKRNLEPVNSFAQNKSLVFTDNIIFAKDVTMLSIMIVDINDNHPQFINPPNKRFVVGFPAAEAPIQLFAENIIQVVAVDNDQGLNAKIRYSIQPNEHFDIDPISGKVYPYANAMQEKTEISLLVYATDRDGGSDGLSARFTLVIKVLAAKHFTLLTFTNENIKSVEALMDDAKNSTGLNFTPVKPTMTSTDKTLAYSLPMFKAGSVKFLQKVWAYAFAGDVPIPSVDIKRKLSGHDINILAQTMEEVVGVIDGVELNCIQNVTGYIVGLSVLALMICACVGIIVWRCIVFDHIHIHNEPGNNLSSRGPTNQNFNLKQGAEIDIQKQADILNDVAFEPSFYSRRESVKILGTTTKESTDDGKRYQMQKFNSTLNEPMQENSDGTESDSSNESMRPRATVTFNELVERIHIESDDEDKIKS